MSNQKNVIFIGNLNFRTDEDGLQEVFGSFGEITNVAIPKDRTTNRPRGFAFVTFESDEAAQAALAIDGNEIDGRNVRVSLAQSKAGAR